MKMFGRLSDTGQYLTMQYMFKNNVRLHIEYDQNLNI